MEAPTRLIVPEDVLLVAQPRRLLHERVDDADGQSSLHLYWGELQITFDDPALIPFGEKLTTTSKFHAHDAMGWTTSVPHSWETVKELLETLLAQGFLEVAAAAPPKAIAAQALATAADAPRGCPVAHGPPPGARTWTAETSESISAAVFGFPVEVGNLETLIRSSRIAHPTVDVAGRQLGDENTFPPALLLDVPTEHRVCPYRGSRFENERPMNVTGLKLVQGAWPQILRAIDDTKREFVRRRERAGGDLDLAEIFLYATIILSIPAYLMRRSKDALVNGEVPMALSGLFRAIDGTRYTARHLALTGESPPKYDLVPTPERFYLHAEKERLLFTDRGVCAGPPPMIREFLTRVLSGEPGQPSGEAPVAGLEDLREATDYALASCELETLLDLFWVQQARIIDRLRGCASGELRARLERCTSVAATPTAVPILLVTPAARPQVAEMFREVVRRCRRMRGREPVTMSDCAGARSSHFEERVQDLAARIGTEAEIELDPALLREVAVAWASLLSLEDELLTQVVERQAEINDLLGCPQPARRFGAREVAQAWPAMSLRRALSDALGVEVDADAGGIVVRGARAGAGLARPRSVTPEGFATLRRLFARTRYSVASAAWRCAGRSFDGELEAARALVPLTDRPRAAYPPADALDLLLDLFMVPRRASAESFVRFFDDAERAALVESGLVTIDDGEARSRFAIGAIDGLVFVTDTQETIRAHKNATHTAANELVMPAYPETYFFARKTHRHPVERAADLCTGSGVHALLASRYARAVVGSDISARAIAFAEFNKRLNGLDNVTFVVGSVWDALGEARFDRVTANPPYQPDSRHDSGTNWWGAGPRGDGIISLILRGIDAHLAPGAELQMVGQVFDWSDGDATRRIRGHLGSAAERFDVRLDVAPTSIQDLRAQYPHESLTGLVGASYGVTTLTRRS